MISTLRSILTGIEFDLLQGDLDQTVKGINYDSRKIESSNLFICVKGQNVDGHDFVQDAITRGATAVVVEQPVEIPSDVTVIKVKNSRKVMAAIAANYYNNPSHKLRLIGVTGTNGKTTTTNLIEAIFNEADMKVGLIGTIENRIGEHSFPVSHTTPENLELQKLLNVMVAEQAIYSVMEVSSHALDLERVYGVEFDVAVFTNLTQDHLDYHKNIEHYMNSKLKLFKELGKSNHKKREKFAVINIDDKFSDKFIHSTGVKVITYGIKKECDVKAERVKVTNKGVSYLLKYWGGSFALNLQLTGLFNVYNSLAAASVALKDGIPPEVVKKALEKVTGVAGRFETVQGNQKFTVIVDYAHTPDSLENVLQTAKGFVKGRLITVFGCGGDRDRTKRPEMGKVAAKHSDFCVITSDNPRSEEPLQIIEDIIPGVESEISKNQYKVIENRLDAIESAIKVATEGDIIIIAGKGHETYQVVKDEVYPFDDRLVAKQVLRSMGYEN
ncbi:UDP-N-acetylmuramoyl-L-alanyl-D-glutamate--2,6-diaminopimelate ligase [Desulfitispora alkaliphila]|uniref:UDP-N-acetylmuramoyl-L-alanyl-D-glutamate--2, 6-diaminopimelate ligase n=1 Tax=Desulfitispora alkaliphila TaxID=622674 RepID=UPI003D19FF7F